MRARVMRKLLNGHVLGRYARSSSFARRCAIPTRSLMLALGLVGCMVLNGCALPFGSNGAQNKSTQHTEASPTPTSTVQGQLAQQVYLNIWGLGVKTLDTTYDAQHTTVKVKVTLGGTTPNTPVKASAAQELTKGFCLMAQQALWTSGVPLTEVTVTIQGPIQDEYADTITDVYGIAVVEAGTAQRIHWNDVSIDAAWQDYDHVFLRGSFELVD